MRKLFTILAIIAISSPVYALTQTPAPEKYDWVWNVVIIPPSTGWESEPGKSINTALTWCEREISESSNGIGGHDLVFRRLTISGDVSSYQNAGLNIDGSTIAVMSFAGLPELDRVIVSRLAGRDIPLMLSGGESIPILPRIQNIFALDMFRDYRASAFAEYAAKRFDRGKRIALAASRFTVNQEREAKICYDILDRAGFMPMPYWTDASVRDSFAMMEQEIESYEGEEAGVLISFMGSMGAREIWRNFMRLRSTWELWNCADPDDLYLSCRGMIFADQNIKLADLGGFAETRRMLLMTRALRVEDSVAAGRVIALYEWLKKAVELMPQPVDAMPKAQLLRNMSRVQAIPFGNQVLNISPNMNRPESRNVFIVEVRDRKYNALDTVNTRGLVYNPDY